MDLLAPVTSRSLAPREPGLGIVVTRGGPTSAGEVAPIGGAISANAGPTTGGFANLDFGTPHRPSGEPEAGVSTGVLPIAALRRPDTLAALPAIAERKPQLVPLPPDPSPGSGLTRQLIKTHLDRQRGGLIACYKKAVQAAPTLEGKVVLAFKISPTGGVLAPRVQSSTVASAPLEACLLGKIALFRFPPSESGAVSSVTYPLLFRVRGESKIPE